MNNLNSILLEGVLEEDPVFRQTPKGRSVCTFTIISKRYYQDGKEDNEVDSGACDMTVDEFYRKGIRGHTNHFDVETWDTLAKAVRDKGEKNRGCRVVGSLREDRWTGVDGRPCSKVSIVAEHVEFRPEQTAKKRTSTKKKA